MKIAVFGGTGKTGQLLVEKLLTNGFEVSVLVRNPAKLDLQHQRLTLVTGDALNAEAVDQTVAGAQAVASLLGPSKGQAPLTISVATDNIIAAMQTHGVKRLIFTAGAGVGDPADQPTFVHNLINFILKSTARTAYDDMLEATSRVRTSGLDWTIARVPMLVDQPGTGAPNTGYLGNGAGSRLSREDLANFILEQLKANVFVQQAPVISN